MKHAAPRYVTHHVIAAGMGAVAEAVVVIIPSKMTVKGKVRMFLAALNSTWDIIGVPLKLAVHRDLQALGKDMRAALTEAWTETTEGRSWRA